MAPAVLDYSNSKTYRNLVKRLEHSIQDEHTPLVSKLVTWLNILTFVGVLEDVLLEDEAEAVLKRHQSSIESAIVLGGMLLEEPGVDEALGLLKCTKKDIEAKLTMLRHSDRMWHGDLTQEKATQILAEVFCG